MFQWLRRGQCGSKDEILVVSSEEHKQPMKEQSLWMQQLTQFKPPDGPRFPDGSINWQCPCMAGGALVAHRCGHYFRQFYVCVSDHNYEDATIHCPDQFVNWSSCLQNLSDERREQMRAALVDDNQKSKAEEVKTS